MQHMVPRGDFPLDVEGGFATEQSSDTSWSSQRVQFPQVRK